MRDHTRRRETATASATAGAGLAESHFRTAMTVETKADKNDLVTRADRETQRVVVGTIRDRFPDARIVGEENDADGTVPAEGPVWVVDPIDGTDNFVRGNRRWATSVTCLVDGEPVAATNVFPALGDTYVAVPDGVRRNGDPVTVSDRTDPERFSVVPTIWWDHDRRGEYAAATRAIVERFGDLRRVGSAQGALSLLAAGTLDGVITNVDTNAWDTVAGVMLVRRAGGTVTDLDGNRWRHDSRGLVASSGTAHDAVLDAANEIARSP